MTENRYGATEMESGRSGLAVRVVPRTPLTVDSVSVASPGGRASSDMAPTGSPHCEPSMVLPSADTSCPSGPEDQR